VEQAEEWDVDYLGVSPVFETPTKTDTKGSWGLEGIARIRAYSRHPLIVIGGLNAANAGAAMQAGADGIAVVSAICAAPDPFLAAQEICRIIDEQPHPHPNPPLEGEEEVI
jgi:thiamine-phosphate pyrophosphorylase